MSDPFGLGVGWAAGSFAAGGFSGALDGLQEAPVGAWSTARLLTTDYDGNPLIRLRRAIDNVEQDIGHTASGELDTDAAATFIGASSGFIVTIYDQIGANDLTAPADANEPAYNETALGGKPCGVLNGTAHHWAANGLAASFSGEDQPLSLIMATKADDFSQSQAFWGLGSSVSSTPFFAALAGATQIAYRVLRRDDGNNSASANSGVSLVEDVSLAMIFPGTTVSGYLGRNIMNGMNGAALNVTALTINLFAIGAIPAATPVSFFDGNIAEAILFTSAIADADRQAITDSQRAFYDMPAAGVFAASTLQQLPDAQGGDLGEGFTCTGLAQDSLGRFWFGNHGLNVAGSLDTPVPSLVLTSSEGSTLVDEIDIATLRTTTSSIQGVAIDDEDATVLWYALSQDNIIAAVSTSGVEQNRDISKTAPNGLAVDSSRSRLWYTSGNTLFRIDKTGTQEFTVDLNAEFGLTDVDHLHYDAERDELLISSAANGIAGFVHGYHIPSGTIRRVYRLVSATAIEGIVRDGTSLYAAHDGHFHAPDGAVPADNQLQTYEVAE